MAQKGAGGNSGSVTKKGGDGAGGSTGTGRGGGKTGHGKTGQGKSAKASSDGKGSADAKSGH